MGTSHFHAPADIRITLPPWVPDVLAKFPPYRTDEDKMRLVIALARENVLHKTGGPFGAAVFRQPDSRLVAIGINRVENLRNSMLHAEVIALMGAEKRLNTYTLGAPDFPPYELITSCAPCAMCLGAALWSGVRRIVCGAGRSDAAEIGFDEGPVFSQSYQYLEARGIEIIHDLLRDEARDVFRLYSERNGLIYNG